MFPPCCAGQQACKNEMWPCVSAGHGNWNHLDPDQAPQPQDPDATEVTVNDGREVQGNVDTPFQCSANVLHHCRSARKLSRIWWWPLVALGVRSRSIIRRRNALPGLTTRQACWSKPINDSNSRLRQDFRDAHFSNAACKWDNFSAGRRSVPDSISISIPRNVRQ